MAARIILIGFMGSGKTSVARRLAKETGWVFHDIDKLIEERAGSSINEIFASRGEPGFRKLEENMISEVLSDSGEGPRRVGGDWQDDIRGGAKPAVVSLGGGAVTNKKVIKMLEPEPLVVWLDVELETAFDRAQNGKRPLARDADQFAALYRQRENIYRRVAKITVDTSGKNVKKVVSEITAKISERTGGS